MDRKVFLALLSLDSYNRGYGARIDNLSESGSIGHASILTTPASETENWEDAGFYAIAYNWNGEKIISYRGTDNLTNISDPANDFWSYGIGAGDPYNMTSTSYGTTVGLAATF